MSNGKAKVLSKEEEEKARWDAMASEADWLNKISHSIDRYIKHRIQSDKVLEGILKDIQGNIASVDDMIENYIAIHEGAKGPDEEDRPKEKPRTSKLINSAGIDITDYYGTESERSENISNSVVE